MESISKSGTGSTFVFGDTPGPAVSFQFGISPFHKGIQLLVGHPVFPLGVIGVLREHAHRTQGDDLVPSQDADVLTRRGLFSQWVRFARALFGESVIISSK